MSRPALSSARLVLTTIVGPDRVVDGIVLQACGARVWRRAGQKLVMRWPDDRFDLPLWEVTGHLVAARMLIAHVLPDFWVTSGLCALTGHASIGPDYNGPAGDRLHQEWPEDEFHAGFDADLSPGDGPHRECAALLDCLLQALEQKPALVGASNALTDPSPDLPPLAPPTREPAGAPIAPSP